MRMNAKGVIELCLDDEVMEEVNDHVYLGTVISKNGERV